ncbi:MAG: hypothetical protein QXK66_02180 [Sulfolobales archaeon]
MDSELRCYTTPGGVFRGIRRFDKELIDLLRRGGTCSDEYILPT